MPKKNEPMPGTLGHRIRQLREDNDLSQESLAKLVRTNKNTVSLIESGKQDLYVHQLDDYARALNTSVYYLVTGVHDDNCAVADDLDLTDYSISFLRSWNKKLKHERETEEYLILRNNFKIIIDILTHNPEFVEQLYQYFCRYDFNSFVYKVDDFGDDSFVDYERAEVKDILGFPLDSLERVYRLRILDELKSIRDSFEAERTKMHLENMAHDRKIEQQRQEYYKSLPPEDPDEDDVSFYQRLIDNVCEYMKQQKEEKENGND